MKSRGMILKKRLLEVFTRIIPLAIIGGVCSALYIGSDIEIFGRLGSGAFELLPVMLSIFTAYSIGGISPVVPAAVVGYYAESQGMGMVGGLLAGGLVGVFSNKLESLDMPMTWKPFMTIFFSPMIVTVITGLILFLCSLPLVRVFTGSVKLLEGSSEGSIVLLAGILGVMISMDMGGPINKVAYFFGVNLLGTGRTDIMGVVSTAIAVPPLSMALYKYLNRRDDTEDESVAIALILGVSGITEGAIPLLVRNPIKLIFSSMVGTAGAAMIAAYLKVGSRVPHGGLIMLPFIEKKGGFLLATAAGMILTNIFIWALRPKETG